MPYAEDEDDQLAITDLIDNPVVTDADAQFTLTSS
ncbi:hypothetical protein JOF49_000984 [Corynebacterium suicordis]|nr:hypothetical protein [Corynebacterium suicordis]